MKYRHAGASEWQSSLARPASLEPKKPSTSKGRALNRSPDSSTRKEACSKVKARIDESVHAQSQAARLKTQGAFWYYIRLAVVGVELRA